EILEKNPAPDAQIATVNGSPIHTGQVDAAYQMYRRTLAQRGQQLTPEDDKNLRATSFRMVVADELLNQAAIKAGIKVPPADVDKALATAQSRVGSPQQWAQFMKDSHLTPQLLRTQVERNLRTDAYRKSLMANKSVTEQQAKEFYDRNRETFKVPESIHTLVILLPVAEKDGAPERAEAKRLAEEARGKAAAGEDFGALARQYSRDPSAQHGGDIGFVPRGLLFPASEQVAFALKKGEISPVLETPKGYTVFKVLERKAESVPTFDDVKQGLMQDMGRVMGQNILEQKVKELSDAAEIVVIDPRSQGSTPTAGK
ncbi:MAG TPA: peptidylprolyl isomerase, partial [Candidatus Polarisedimenticolaceae bacterium]|nr:peptidylprolyl isomerase [Candidatus Polarisedimenticolaceae bacterium]